MLSLIHVITMAFLIARTYDALESLLFLTWTYHFERESFMVVVFRDTCLSCLLSLHYSSQSLPLFVWQMQTSPSSAAHRANPGSHCALAHSFSPSSAKYASQPSCSVISLSATLDGDAQEVPFGSWVSQTRPSLKKKTFLCLQLCSRCHWIHR